MDNIIVNSVKQNTVTFNFVYMKVNRFLCYFTLDIVLYNFFLDTVNIEHSYLCNNKNTNNSVKNIVKNSCIHGTKQYRNQGIIVTVVQYIHTLKDVGVYDLHVCFDSFHQKEVENFNGNDHLDITLNDIVLNLKTLNLNK